MDMYRLIGTELGWSFLDKTKYDTTNKILMFTQEWSVTGVYCGKHVVYVLG
jgi:hypothetical protein